MEKGGRGEIMEKGGRVGAVLGSEEKVVQFLGYGVYEGDFVPAEAVGFMADALRENDITNPKIRLDNGRIVYGCECWWGPEGAVKKRIEGWKTAGYQIVDVDMDEIRKEIKVK